ncbi:MAG: hypothetical protein D6743_03305 [Calditrichaeota bacterium]|nr:MAG: hypothetical protein D6743_03305 [Calditrichota bacterium]
MEFGIKLYSLLLKLIYSPIFLGLMVLSTIVFLALGFTTGEARFEKIGWVSFGFVLGTALVTARWKRPSR